MNANRILNMLLRMVMRKAMRGRKVDTQVKHAAKVAKMARRLNK